MSLQQSPEEQRNVLIAVVLIALVSFVWMWYTTPGVEQKPSAQEPPITDTSAAQQREQVAEEARQQEARQQKAAQEQEEEQALAPVADSALAGAQQGEARRITVETDLYEAVFSTKGATPVAFTLKEYKQFDQETPVQLIDTSKAGALSLAFTTPENHNVDTRSFYFAPSLAGGDSLAGSRVTVAGEDTTQLVFTAQVGQGQLRQVYTFTGDTYGVDLRVEQTNPASFATSAGYDVLWHGGVPYTEGSPEDEAPQSAAFARTGGDIVELRLQSEDDQDQSLSGQVDWTAVRNKYFTAVVMPGEPTRGAELTGEKPDPEAYWKNFTTRLEMPAARSGQVDTYQLYLGPVDYTHLSDYDLGLYGMVDYGWDIFEIVTRPLAIWLFIPLFSFLSSFIPSYGVVIILLAIFVKTAVYPLTKSSYKSMAKMREMQPQMEAIKEKYSDDPQKQQKAMMKLYKEEGANPIGGCLPMLLQYPFIIALYQFIPQSIQLRQQSFLWAHDLSAPDVIMHLPFTIPFYGDYVSGFTLLMGLSMVVTMRMQSSSSGASGGQMKMLTYLFPVMIFFIFNRFASALSLYYLVYNVMTALQQRYINKQIHEEKEANAGANGKGTRKDAKKAKRRREKART